MSNKDSQYRIEHDSMGELQVPAKALYGAQTQRAVDNFPISGQPMPAAFIRALAQVKYACAVANEKLGLLENDKAEAIKAVAQQIADGQYIDHFPIDIFQTGSGTSTNMNANEVIARLASTASGLNIHPNDHVNMSQSSNDVIPTTLHVSACLEINQKLRPALEHLANTIEIRADELKNVIKTGRTHLMDAMPVSLGQELGAWKDQIEQALARIDASLPRLLALVQGGTAVGTGINAHPQFGSQVAHELTEKTGLPFTTMNNYFSGLASQDSAVEMSGQLKTLAVSMMKISNDLRWMNSGPLAGLSEIALPALQPGSSIMPGKINPVIPEAVAMVCAQVIGNDTAITLGGQSGSFQLNVMLPLIAHNLLQNIELLCNAARLLADKAIDGFSVNRDNINQALRKNPILVTALNRVIGYEKGAAIAKKAYAENRAVMEVALEMTELDEAELKRLLDPAKLAQGGLD
ncbi:Fumarate hydratase class II [hydrothermal vent metagenome]|uniref:fumarate hydratase n=1 Tax=hydrothermal vent metagenome TaxID=652676 RepID=A0A3B1AYR3_9ZZZZ